MEYHSNLKKKEGHLAVCSTVMDLWTVFCTAVVFIADSAPLQRVWVARITRNELYTKDR